MGGRLFSKGANPLYIPRLAPPIYKHVYSQLSTTLNSLFPCVSKPVEGPAKLSFGDIDLLVNLEGSAFNQEQKEDPTRTDIWTAVEKALRPERIYYERSKVIDVKSLAVPWPKDLSPDQMRLQLAVEPEVPLELLENAKAQAQAQAQTKAAELSETDEQSRSPASGEAAAGASQENDVQPDDTAPVLVARYIQVDIRLCDTTQDLEWHKFKNAHGDLWLLLGTAMRHLGLFLDNKGLQLSVHNHLRESPKSKRIFLSNDPTAILDFLGLSHANGEWTRPFVSLAELFQYVKTFRWYSWRPVVREPEFGSRMRRNIRDRPALASYYQEDQSDDTDRSNRNLDARLEEVRRAIFSAFPDSERAFTEEVARCELEAEVQRWRQSVKNIIQSDSFIPANIDHVLPEPRSMTTNKADAEQVWRQVLRAALEKVILRQYKLDSVEVPDFDHSHGIQEVKKWIRDNWEAVGREAWHRVEEEMVRSQTSKGASLLAQKENTSVEDALVGDVRESDAKKRRRRKAHAREDKNRRRRHKIPRLSFGGAEEGGVSGVAVQNGVHVVP